MIEREITVVFCRKRADWRLLPEFERDHSGWPRITVFRWLALYVRVRWYWRGN